MEDPLILDRYRPLADLGSGGYGSVTLAYDTKMARRVAIKRLPLPVDRSGRPIGRTGLAEARTAALLNHPNIVTVHEWDTDADEAFIVMEDLDGASVADLLDETGESLTLDEAAAIVAAVSAAVTFAHANGVLHLDLKPANVLVNRDGRVKVADFGVSALTDITGRASGTAGTIGYMPPEQIRGEQLDERTDCWALAALTYELLTNANPFDSDTAEGSLFKIEVADIPAPSEFEPDLPRAVDDILIAALAEDPDERYASVAEFVAAILPFLGDPETGRESLQTLVSDSLEDEVVPAYAPLGLWDRLARYSKHIRRAASAFAAFWLAVTGIGTFGLGTAPFLAAAGLIALAAALAPGLGMALGFGAFSLGILRIAGWPAFLLFAAPAAAFWVLRGRHGAGDALAPVVAPLLGLLRAAPGVPLLLGFTFEPLPAALSAAAAALATIAASATSGRPPIAVSWRFFVNPFGGSPILTEMPDLSAVAGVVAITASWAFAAAACSLLCRRATRPAAILAAILGTGLMALGHGAATALAGGDLAGSPVLLDLTFGLALTGLVISLGAPTRGEDD
ncbi:MAG: serine/threonine protein kinase [Coriobacteriia bacterium]|nr:serine/threonine protein kinase [Coriobacteriia bacterium]